jgi:PAS domain S-box-containing protein
VLVAIVASHVVLGVAGRVSESKGKARYAWLVGGSFAMGLGLWSMHFIGLLSLRLPVAVAYNIPFVLLSAFLGVAASGYALSIVSRPDVPLSRLLRGSVVLAITFAGMHYLQMASVRISGEISYRPWLIVASLLAALLASFLVLFLAARMQRDRSARERLHQLFASIAMGSALAGMHYIASAAADFKLTPGATPGDGDDFLATFGVTASVVMSAAVLLGITLMAVIVDRELERRAELAAESRRLYEMAEAARAEARERATHAEELSEELQNQAAHLQEQAIELEAINQEMESTSARLRSVVDSALDAIVTIDEKGYVIDWNRRAEQMFGWTAKEAVGELLEDLIIPPAYKEAHRNGLARYVQTGEEHIINRRVQVRGMRRDGSELPVELTIAPARAGARQIFSSFMRDLTREQLADRRVVAEHEVVRVLAESHTREEAAPRVLEAVGAALGWEVGVFWGLDAGAGVLRFVDQWHSPAFAGEEFDMSHSEMRFTPGEGLPGRVWATRRAQWIADVLADSSFARAEAAARAGLKSAVAFPILHAGECLGVIEFFNEEAVEPEPGLMEMIGAIGIGIGQAMRRIEAEEERDHVMHRIEEANVELARRSVEAERARTQADEANRAKSDFLATMSHELRTPLNAVLGYADLLAMQIEGPLTAGQRAQLERIEASGRHLLMLIEDVLDLSKIEARRLGLEQRREGVEDATVGAVSLVAPQAAERGVEVVNDCVGTTISFIGDGNRLRQILLNLLSNAVKFTEPGGRVTVRCGTAEIQPPEESAAEGAGPWTFVEVEDNGIGIAPEEIRAIFEPFVQAEMGRTRSYGGTGLGLTISQRLARLMGGDLTVKSTPGAGSCFRVWLQAPRMDERSVPVSDEAAGPAALAQLGLRLQEEQQAILDAAKLRMRADPEISVAGSLDDATLEDHQAAFVIDAGQMLVAIAEPERDPHLLRDGNDLRQLIASRHGVQRARLGWSPRAIQREYEILAEEIDAKVLQCATPSTPRAVVRRAQEILRRMAAESGETAVAVLRATGVE